MKLMDWSKTFEDLNYRVIGHDIVNGYRISTVWLGLDHEIFGGPPLIFETMAFQGDRKKYLERYSTIDEAILGHKIAIRLAEIQPAGSVMDLRL